VRAFIQAASEEGSRIYFKVKSGTSDMNVVGPVWQCPIVAYGPGDSSLDHTPDEHLDLREYHRAIDLLARVIAAF
jgi:LysW-gamma-L-lysine carboxypeptidase